MHLGLASLDLKLFSGACYDPHWVRHGAKVILALSLCYPVTWCILPVACTPTRSTWSPWPKQGHRTYATDFPLTENPISEGGNWTNGKTDGIDWSDIRTTAGFAFGTQVPPSGPPFNDSVALLMGVWLPDQMATGIVHTTNQQGGNTYEEVELWLRAAISQHRATGYEINFRCLAGQDSYVQVTSWDGALNEFTRLSAITGPGIHEGDIVAASIVGNTITVWINGIQVLQDRDPKNRYSSGHPGIGFYHQGSTGSNSDFGFTSFMASDEFQAPLSPASVAVAVE
jgi:hypothetical protein